MIGVDEEVEPLREPKSDFQKLVRRLAEAAMQVTHHDAADYEQGYIHEVQLMERRFGPMLRGFMAAKTRKAKGSPDA
jgi:hypothetical protein